MFADFETAVTNKIDIAGEIVERAIARHGGLDAFASCNTITIRVEQLSGSIPFCKGIGRTFRRPTEVQVSPRRRKARFVALGDGGQDIEFDSGSILCGDDRHEAYRQTFDGLKKLRRWSPNDAAYFFGYALCDYFSFPFSLQSLRVNSAAQFNDGGSRLGVVFPPGADTHSQHQALYLDSTGLLVRHDYRADVIGPLFFGAHHSTNYRFDTPVPIAETRRVTARLGRLSTPITVLKARFTVEAVQ